MTALALMESRVRLQLVARPSTAYCAQHAIDWRATQAAMGGVYAAPIRLTPLKRFEFDPDSDTIGIVCEAIGADGETIVDLACWSAKDPTRVRTAVGVAGLLGEAVAANPATTAFGHPLRLWRHPLNWLKHACDGAAIVDLDRAVRWLLDLEVKALGAEDDAHAREIHEARLRLIQRTPIVVLDPRQNFVEAA